MIYTLNYNQIKKMHDFIDNIDPVSFQYGADRVMHNTIVNYLHSIVLQSEYIERMTGELPTTTINYDYLCWIINNIGDGVFNSFNERIKRIER